MSHSPSNRLIFSMRRQACLLLATAGLAAGGCRDTPPAKPLSSAAFYNPSPEPPGAQTDRTGAPPPASPPRPTATPVRHRPASRPTDPGLAANSAANGRPASSATRPASDPTTRSDPADGGYLTLGAVLAEVNGRAIYADEVFADISDALRDKAMALDSAAYRTAAADLIRQALNARISSELAYTAAERFLTKDDKRLADAATERWRQEQITEAGGSLQLARSKARKLGQDFEAMVRRQARLFTIDVYREKKIVPKVQVTVQDMREYYQHNRDKLYTQEPSVHFLLIRVDPQRSGGRAEAMKKIQDIRRRALGGEDFGTLAHDMSDSALLRSKNGDAGWVDRGAFRVEAVEKAAWALQPGHLSPIIEADGAFYLVKLLAVRRKKVLPFDNEQVQSEIRRTLRNRQMAQLLAQAEQKLREEAAVSENPQAMAVTMEMAMQKYAQWRQGAHPSQAE